MVWLEHRWTDCFKRSVGKRSFHSSRQHRTAIAELRRSSKLKKTVSHSSSDWTQTRSVAFRRVFFISHFIVGPRSFPDYEGTEMNFPYGSPFVTAAFPSVETVPIWSGRFSLQETEVQIRSAQVPGTLTVPVVVTSA